MQRYMEEEEEFDLDDVEEDVLVQWHALCEIAESLPRVSGAVRAGPAFQLLGQDSSGDAHCPVWGWDIHVGPEVVAGILAVVDSEEECTTVSVVAGHGVPGLQKVPCTPYDHWVFHPDEGDLFFVWVELRTMSDDVAAELRDAVDFTLEDLLRLVDRVAQEEDADIQLFALSWDEAWEG